MEDKEVGKLWRESGELGWTRPLIRKLVEERKILLALSLEEALKQFGIPEDEWD